MLFFARSCLRKCHPGDCELISSVAGSTLAQTIASSKVASASIVYSAKSVSYGAIAAKTATTDSTLMSMGTGPMGTRPEVHFKIIGI